MNRAGGDATNSDTGKARWSATRAAGAHYKPHFPERDDAAFLKTTLAKYEPAKVEVSISYGPVDTSLVQPRARTYGKKDSKPTEKKEPAAAGV